METMALTDSNPAASEEIWAILRETAKRQEETAKWQEKTARLQEESAKRREEEYAKQEEERVKREKEYAKREEERSKREEEPIKWRKETEEQRNKSEQEWNERFSKLSNRFGELAEHLVAPKIHERFNELGYHFPKEMPGGVKIRENGKIITQIDLLLENHNIVMAIEVKVKPDEDDIADHIKRLEKLRDFNQKERDLRKVEGAITGAIFGSSAKMAVIKAGLYVIVQSGDTMKIEVSEGFVPRKW